MALPFPAQNAKPAKQDLPEDPREQQSVYRILRDQLRGLDELVARGDADFLERGKGANQFSYSSYLSQREHRCF